MKITIAVVMGITILLSCTTKETVTLETLLPPTDSSTSYFPLTSSRRDTTANALDSFVNTWYSQMLFALHEPVLKDYAGSQEIYRFTWLRTFHHPVSIRLEKKQPTTHGGKNDRRCGRVHTGQFDHRQVDNDNAAAVGYFHAADYLIELSGLSIPSREYY